MTRCVRHSSPLHAYDLESEANQKRKFGKDGKAVESGGLAGPAGLTTHDDFGTFRDDDVFAFVYTFDPRKMNSILEKRKRLSENWQVITDALRDAENDDNERKLDRRAHPALARIERLRATRRPPKGSILLHPEGTYTPDSKLSTIFSARIDLANRGKRSKNFLFRISDLEREEIRRAALSVGLSSADFVRQAVFEKLLTVADKET